MSEDEKEIADCYSAADRPLMTLSQNVRAKTLQPILSLLVQAGFSANHLTVLALIVGLLFAPLYFISKGLALLALYLHVCLDGLDGPLARHTNTASRKGSFTDTMSDQLVVAASTVTLIEAKVIGVLPGSIYVLAYTLVVGFAMLRNALKIPYSWLVRPRFVVYAWFIVEFYYLPGSLNYVLWMFNGLLVWKVYTGFRKIREEI